MLWKAILWFSLLFSIILPAVWGYLQIQFLWWCNHMAIIMTWPKYSGQKFSTSQLCRVTLKQLTMTHKSTKNTTINLRKYHLQNHCHTTKGIFELSKPWHHFLTIVGKTLLSYPKSQILVQLSSDCHLLDLASQLHGTRLAYAWYLLAKCLTIACKGAQNLKSNGQANVKQFTTVWQLLRAICLTIAW